MERIANAGPLAAGAKVQVKARRVGVYAGAHVVPDRAGGGFTAGRVAAGAGAGAGLVDVELWAEEFSGGNGEFVSAGYTAEWRVDRGAVYGGAPALQQPLPEGYDPRSMLAMATVYADAGEAKPLLDARVAACAAAAERRGGKGAGAIAIHPPEDLKQPLRAATKALEKYRGSVAG